MKNILLIIPIIALIIYIVCHIMSKRKNKRAILEQKIIRKEFNTTDKEYLTRITDSNSKYKILIVEDDPVNRKILTSQLSAAKYKVVDVVNGESALKAINDDPNIDLVLLDIMLPDLSGFTVCKAIREKYTMFEKPVIMVTAKNKIEDLLDGFQVGANDFIIKPYNIYELIARINSSLSLKSVVEHNTSLKKINKLKSDIIDMAAHDLKSPLTIISGYARRLIKNLGEDSNERDNAEKILNSSNKMLNIVSRLLEDSKYYDFILNFETLNIVELIDKSINFYSDTAKQKKQYIKVDKSSNSIDLKVDRESFYAIVDNLLSNAIKYSPLNSIISVSIEDKLEKCVISISDEGDGFTKEELDNLFNKYFPITNKPTNGESSTGLGLSIVHNMVKRNNGFIQVESEKMKGSKFILTFPKS